MPTTIPHFIPGWIQLRLRMQTVGGDLIMTWSCTPTVTGTRFTAAQLRDVAAAFRDGPLLGLPALIASDTKFIDVTASDLGDALGETGTIAYATNTFGTSSGERLPANVALATTWRTKYRGPRYRGRSFWGGFTEAAFNGDVFTSAFALALSNIISQVVVFSGSSSAPVKMVVASRLHQLLTPIIGTALTTVADTMKRRLTGHGR
jgi:hypothetical protein